LNAVELEILDPGGAGIVTLLGPPQVPEFVMRLLRALGELVLGVGDAVRRCSRSTSSSRRAGSACR
jgi:hypothetical protein